MCHDIIKASQEKEILQCQIYIFSNLTEEKPDPVANWRHILLDQKNHL